MEEIPNRSRQCTPPSMGRVCPPPLPPPFITCMCGCNKYHEIDHLAMKILLSVRRQELSDRILFLLFCITKPPSPSLAYQSSLLYDGEFPAAPPLPPHPHPSRDGSALRWIDCVLFTHLLPPSPVPPISMGRASLEWGWVSCRPPFFSMVCP